ncbi:Peptidase family U32 [uncultured archaeon]|nr:Peptidase family U32 [uncultured archaeon]
MRVPELLAPVGSKESLIAAIENGADAVYFGGSAFNARQYTSNFNREELEWAIDHAHKMGIKAYVTVNTLIKDSELEEATDYLRFLCNAGADAVIVQDLGILRLLREQLPVLPIHASTQMTIHNAEGVKFLQEMGVKRVVLARELSLDEIQKIKSETAMEIETFIHGALCFSYSGQCLLSSMIGGRSGNRGYCAQPCRKKYRINDVEGYLLSPKDLNMSEHIGALVKAGVDSFKIEGRMKRPEYVAGVVRVYRKLIDRFFEAPGKFRVTESEKHTLRQLFNREFTTGYFFGNPGCELMSRKYPHNIGTELGRVLDYEARKKLVSIYLKAPLRTGDGIGIGEQDTGVIVKGMYVNNQRVAAASPGSTVRIYLDTEVAADDVVFKTYDAELMASLEAGNARKIPVRMLIKARINEAVELRISDGENDITVRGAKVSRAEVKPISKNSITEQLKKLGNTIFEAQEIRFEIDDNIFIPVSGLNSLRREAVSLLEGLRAQKWKRQCSMLNIHGITPGERKPDIEPVLSVNAGSIECLEAAVDSGADAVYIGGENFGGKIDTDDLRYAIEYGKGKGVSVFISTARIVKEVKNLRTDLAADGFLVANLGVLYSLHRSGVPVIFDYPFNVFNKITMEYLLNYGQRITLSPELTLNEIKNLTRFGSTECIVHGLFPLMVSEHGLIGGLFPGNRTYHICLKDEKGFVFPVRTDSHGRTYIMNSRELCMLEYVPELIKTGVDCLRIEAKTYDKEKTRKITGMYREAIDSSIGGKRSDKECNEPDGYTKGHYFRGVL